MMALASVGFSYSRSRLKLYRQSGVSTTQRVRNERITALSLFTHPSLRISVMSTFTVARSDCEQGRDEPELSE